MRALIGRRKHPKLSQLYWWACNILLSINCFPCEIPLEKTKTLFVSCYQLEIASGLRMRHASTSPLNSRTSSGAVLCRPCACCLSLCEFICVLALLFLEGFGSLVFSIPSGSYSLSTSSSSLSQRN